jgi:hypothetical protein
VRPFFTTCQLPVDLISFHRMNCGTYSTGSLPVFDMVRQSSNVVAPFGTGMDPVHPVLHTPSSIHPLRRRVHRRPRILHSSTMVSNISRHVRRMHRYLLASQQPVRLGWNRLSTFEYGQYDFRCPAGCDVILQNSRTVGNQKQEYVPLIVGGGDVNGTYRGDSFICSAAVQA